ncbi:unnamed protein product [Acanthoscelides obtectus]|uniref:CUB domain-containing protein n=1 Tax=Acanthoscelides obtectus TaxID=200917 RepID=A0A9P0LKE6_ACAOB|nr:unnamed protein product [Acanthoscelides obtectus]CAK1640662.1 hypothetical protein AOBTE_LOCUS11853 [Acanthoscelides obtectus]
MSQLFLYVLLQIRLCTSIPSVTGCECVVFSTTFGKEKGTFKSPDFPKPYPPNIDCLLYTFVGSTDEIVQLTFQEFDVKKSQSEKFYCASNMKY